MELDITKIVTDKIAQMENDGIIKSAIEDKVEKVVLDSVTSGIESFEVRRAIEKQLKDCVSHIAEDCGLSAYNGLIVQHVREVISGLCTQDITEKLQSALNTMLIRKEEKVKLSTIFERYRQYVQNATDEEDQYKYESFEASIDDDESIPFHHYVCRFADHPLDTAVWPSKKDEADVELRFCTYKDENEVGISTLKLEGERLDKIAKVATLNEFEAYVVNLYLNGTPVVMDVEDAECIDTSYDVLY